MSSPITNLSGVDLESAEVKSVNLATASARKQSHCVRKSKVNGKIFKQSSRLWSVSPLLGKNWSVIASALDALIQKSGPFQVLSANLNWFFHGPRRNTPLFRTVFDGISLPTDIVRRHRVTLTSNSKNDAFAPNTRRVCSLEAAETESAKKESASHSS